MSSLKKSILGGVLWTTIETVINRGFGFVIQLFLAGLLLPEAYGLVGMAVVFISFLEIFNDLGMNAALIQRKKELLTPIHYDTAFWTGIVWSIFLYVVVVVLITPLAASFYNEEKLNVIMPVMSVTILLSPINLVHRAQLIKAMNFKKLALVNNTSNIISGIIALALAFLGAGVWALVFYAIVKVVVALPLFFKATKWTPVFRWSKDTFKEIFGFGAYTTGTSFSNKITGNIDYLLVGKLVGTVGLGYYTFAFILTNTLRSQIVAIINKVIYPVYATLQDNKKKMLGLFLKVVSLNNLIVYPIILGLFLFAEDIVPLFFGNKWNNSIPILKILCFAVFIQMLNNSHTTLFRAAGEVKLELKLQIIKSLVFFVPLISLGVYYYDLIGAAAGYTLATFLGVSLSFYFMHKIFNLKFLEVYKAVKASVFMMLFCLITTLFLKVFIIWWGALIYYILAVIGVYFIFAREQIVTIFKMVKGEKSWTK